MKYLNVQVFITLYTMLIKFLLRLKLTWLKSMTRIDFILLVFVKSKVYENNIVLFIVGKLVYTKIYASTYNILLVQILFQLPTPILLIKMEEFKSLCSKIDGFFFFFLVHKTR